MLDDENETAFKLETVAFQLGQLNKTIRESILAVSVLLLLILIVLICLTNHLAPNWWRTPWFQ